MTHGDIHVAAVHPVAAALAQPNVHFRLPAFDQLKAAYEDKKLKIPESVIKDRVAELLTRMMREGHLKSADPVPVIIGKIFPAPGKLDEAEFNNAVDVKDRSRIYQSILDADTKVKPADEAKLRSAMREAADDVKEAEADDAGLKQVFGSKHAAAKANYTAARRALLATANHLDRKVTTDYNLDDPELDLGGFAEFKSQSMHLLLRNVQVASPADAKATMIHEAAHLANSSVADRVYYGLPGFFEADEATKLGNAAHYEELPRRKYLTSKFFGKTFTPGVMPTGHAATREDRVKAAANRYLQKAWDAAVDADLLIRGVRKAAQAGNNRPFTANRAVLLEISRLMDLTIHKQAPGKATVTLLDLTLSESVARGVGIIGAVADHVPFPAPGTFTDAQLEDQIVAAATARYGSLLEDPVRDKALLDWCVAHFKKVPSV
ncbi:MAG TPA: hypothetical protein VI456_05990 [Polyangia bacterium]